MRDASDTRVAVVGGGLVGSMISCFLARRGFQVSNRLKLILFSYHGNKFKTNIL